jgi:hypothetical protein
MPDVAKEIYVAKSSYNATGDLYNTSGAANASKRTFVKNGYQTLGGHEVDFRPAKNLTH